MFNIFRDNNIITSLQSNFVPRDSTINKLTLIYNTFFQAFDEGKDDKAVFCDITKAFDRVWQNGLIYKLQTNGISLNVA